MTSKVQYTSFSLRNPAKAKCGDASFSGMVTLNDEPCPVLMVADGVSTAPKDWLASLSVVNFIKEHLQTHRLPVVELMKNAVLHANDKLIDGVDNASGMLTTLSLLAYQPSSGKVHWANVGDSRIYGCQEGAWQQLTTDDSTTRPYLENGKMRLRNGVPIMLSALTKAIGASPNPDIEIKEADASAYSGFLLCSDGFYGLAGFSSLADEICNAPEIDQRAEQMQAEILPFITDDASLALLRFHHSGAVDFEKLISGTDEKLPPAYLLADALETELARAIRQNNDLYIGQLLHFMEDKNLTLTRATMITLLEDLLRQKSRHVEVMKALIRKI